MNILWITLESILPANSGGRIGVFKRLEQIKKRGNIYLFYPYDNEQELLYVNELKKYCKEVHPYSRKENRIRALARLCEYPFTIASRNIPAMRYDIVKCIKENQIDLINVDFPHMCVNLLGLNIKVPVVLNEHNVEWKVYQTIAGSQKNIFKKVAYLIDSFRLKFYEKKLFKRMKIDLVTFVSDKDMQFMNKSGICNKNNTCLIPVGADIIELKEISENKPFKNIIFVGKMSYRPNIEAVIWFVNEVMARILETYKNIKFYIVGKEPADEVKKLKSDNVIVTGMVDNVNKYYDIADLVVIPLKNGGGVKVKLLEAISYKKDIVSTAIGVEGTIYANGETIPICDTAADFVKWVLASLSGSKELRYRMEKAYNIFLEKYTWECIGRKYTACLKKLIKSNQDGEKHG